MHRRRPFLVLVPLVLLTAACGDDDSDTTTADGDGGSAGRTIEVRMADNDFDPASVDVEKGETVTFVFENTGAVDHDAFVGDADAQAAHEAEMNGGEAGHMGGQGSEMAETTEMGGHGAADDEGIIVPPGETGELSYRFDESGLLEIGCHEPGHYASGMKVRINVS